MQARRRAGGDLQQLGHLAVMDSLRELDAPSAIHAISDRDHATQHFAAFQEAVGREAGRGTQSSQVHKIDGEAAGACKPPASRDVVEAQNDQSLVFAGLRDLEADEPDLPAIGFPIFVLHVHHAVAPLWYEGLHRISAHMGTSSVNSSSADSHVGLNVEVLIPNTDSASKHTSKLPGVGIVESVELVGDHDRELLILDVCFGYRSTVPTLICASSPAGRGVAFDRSLPTTADFAVRSFPSERTDPDPPAARGAHVGLPTPRGSPRRLGLAGRQVAGKPLLVASW